MSRLTRDYFIGLQKALHKKAICEPVLVIDMPRLNRNIDKLRADLPADMNYRIVAKSLPVPNLLSHIAKRAGTDRFRVLMR